MSRFIKTPVLDRLSRTLRAELDSLTPDELKQLDKECGRTTTLNCEASRYSIAQLYGHHIHCIVKRLSAE